MNLKPNLRHLGRRAHKLFFIDKSDHDLIKSNKSRDDLREDLESEAKKYFNAKYAILMPSGRSAIESILLALNISNTDELITQAYQCSEVPEIIHRHCILKYSDLKKENLNSSLVEIKKAVTKKTRVIMPVNLYGKPAEMKKLSSFCKKKKIFLLEDCAHSLGTQIRNKNLGTFGDAAIFSFAKSLSAPVGGLVLTNNEEVYKRIVAIQFSYEIKNKAKIANFFLRSLVSSMANHRNLQKKVPYALFLEKIYQYFRSSEKDDLYRVALSREEVAICLSQFRKIDKIKKSYIDQYKNFYELMSKNKKIKIFKYNLGENALRFPIIFKKKKDIPKILESLYSQGTFEPSLNYHDEYQIALDLAPTKLKNSEDLKDKMIVLSLDNIDSTALLQLRSIINNYSNV